MKVTCPSCGELHDVETPEERRAKTKERRDYRAKWMREQRRLIRICLRGRLGSHLPPNETCPDCPWTAAVARAHARAQARSRARRRA